MTERQAIKAMQEQLEALYNGLICKNSKLSVFTMGWKCYFCDSYKENQNNPKCLKCPIVKMMGHRCVFVEVNRGQSINVKKFSHKPDDIQTLIGVCEFMLKSC